MDRTDTAVHRKRRRLAPHPPPRQGIRRNLPVNPVQKSYPEYEMCITVADECMMKDVRAMLALGNLEALGTILSVHPPRETLDEGGFEGTLRIMIASDAGVDALKTAASGTEILDVEIRTAEYRAIKAPDTMQEVTSLLQTPEEVIPDSEIRTAEKQEIQASEGVGPAKSADDDKKLSSSADKTREIKNLRVDIHQLDHIMNLIEDLVINRGRLRQISCTTQDKGNGRSDRYGQSLGLRTPQPDDEYPVMIP